MAFRYQAIDAGGKTVTDVIDAASSGEVADLLRERGLFVTHVEVTAEHSAAPAKRASMRRGGQPRTKDLVLFTQQMSMLLRAGARVVQALEAVESQCAKAAWREIVSGVRVEVEAGKPLSEALVRHPRMFNPVFVNMIAAGEASGDLGLAFDRVAKLAQQQQEIRSRVLGALTYPAVLSLLCVTVVIILLTFILPRFKDMFEQLDVELPFMTQVLIQASNFIMGHWWLIVLLLAGAVVGVHRYLKNDAGRRLWSRTAIRIPVFGAIARNIILARVCRIWGQLLDSKVPMLDAVRLTAESTSSLDFQELLTRLETTISDGNSIAHPLRESWLLPKTFAAAIATGEESGKISLALGFVATCLEEENSQVLASLSRVIEPIMLTVMGLIVGTMAVSLFLPMFEMATAAGK